MPCYPTFPRERSPWKAEFFLTQILLTKYISSAIHFVNLTYLIPSSTHNLHHTWVTHFHSSYFKEKQASSPLQPVKIQTKYTSLDSTSNPLSHHFYRRGLELYLRLHSIPSPQFSSSTLPCQTPSHSKIPLRWLVLSLIGYQKQKASLTTRATPKKWYNYTSNPSPRAIQMESCALLLPRYILRNPMHSYSQEAGMSQSGKTALHSQSTAACHTGNYHRSDACQFFLSCSKTKK